MNKTETISARPGPASTAQEEVLNLKDTMKAIAVFPGRPNTIHLREVPKPRVSDVPHGRGVLGNKVTVGSVNANREYFETGVKDLADAELSYPEWLGRLLTHSVEGLENCETLLKTLTEAKGAGRRATWPELFLDLLFVAA